MIASIKGAFFLHETPGPFWVYIAMFYLGHYLEVAAALSPKSRKRRHHVAC